MIFGETSSGKSSMLNNLLSLNSKRVLEFSKTSEAQETNFFYEYKLTDDEYYSVRSKLNQHI